MFKTKLITLIILITISSCQTNPAPSQQLPTLAEFSTLAPLDITQNSRELRTIPTQAVTATLTPLPTSTIRPASSVMLSPASTLIPVSINLPTPIPPYFIFGTSARRNELVAWRFGEGATELMLVGGIHGGWEANTTELMHELITHFQNNPQDILPGMALIIIPALNPDGAALGRVLEGRFNGARVDLNRNWGCDWQETAYFRSQEVSAGGAPFSEPETAALSQLINDVRPATVLFYHSAADGIFTGNCEGSNSRSDEMAQVLGEATGYSYGASFSDYPVTGTAPEWVSSLNIPSADVELATWRSTEFDRNLRGVMALQCWLIGMVLCP